MRAGFNLYGATPQDVADNEAWIAEGGLETRSLLSGDRLAGVEAWAPALASTRKIQLSDKPLLARQSSVRRIFITEHLYLPSHG